MGWVTWSHLDQVIHAFKPGGKAFPPIGGQANNTGTVRPWAWFLAVWGAAGGLAEVAWPPRGGGAPEVARRAERA